MKSLHLFSALAVLTTFQTVADTFPVTTAADSDGDPSIGYSLRDAINDANFNPGPHRIVFAIPTPGGGVARIVLATELPTLREAVEIDGYTQPGARRNTLEVGSDAVLKVEIDATNTEVNYSRALLIRADGCVVSGLILNHALEAGVIIAFGNDNVIAGNWIGVNPDGTSPSPGRGNGDGVWIFGGSRNRAGGPLPADRNLISGNRSSGILIYGDDASENVVLNNYIGTDRSGTLPVPNKIGVWLASSSNQVGDGSIAGRNIISGNSNFGVQISPASGARPQRNTIAGNYVGLAVDGDQPLPNGGTGFVLIDTELNTIGSTVPSAGNIISGNGQAGVYLLSHYGTSLSPDVVTRSNSIVGNYIGTDATGTKARGNGQSGIILEGDTVGSLADNRIGTIELGVRMGNLISGNKGNGIEITGGKATGTIIEANFIGVDKTGGKALPNEWSGILVGPQEVNPSNGSPRTTRIGGTDPSGLAGNVISGNNFDGIALDFAPASTETNGGGHILEGNFVGTDATGKIKIPNGQSGISLHGTCSSCVIGGAQELARNLVSGNAWDGIGLSGTSNTLNRITGNFVGTDRTGKLAIPNGLNGISLGGKVTPLNGVRGNFVGGSQLGERNVISGNGAQGVFIGNGSDNWVQGNYIGLDVTGTKPLGNATYGVAISATTAAQRAATNHIGSAVPGGGNWICANNAGGVVIEGTNAIGNILRGNFIGTDPQGSTTLGNIGNGVRLSDAVGTIIGRGPAGIPDPEQANTIRYNDGYGIQVTGDAAINNCIRGNIISANTDRALLLGAAEVANDPGDKDNGPNGLMNLPIVVRSYYDPAAGVTRITGRVDNAQREQVIIDLYRMTTPVTADSGSAEQHLASATPDKFGRFCAQVPGDLGATVISATATSAEGSTSGFSRAYVAKLRLKALEVTQAIQDWSNSVPLIEGKRTLVRAFLEPLSGPAMTVSMARLNAKLHAFRNGEALLDSPQPPANLEPVLCDADSSIQRANYTTSVDFFLPPGWREGSIEFQFEADGVIGAEPDSKDETPFACRDCAVGVVFHKVPPLALNIADISYFDGGVLFANAPSDALEVKRLVESVFPVPETVVTRFTVSFGNWPASKRCQFVNRKLSDLSPLFGNNRTLGLIPFGPGIAAKDFAGLAGGIKVASAYFSVPVGPLRLTPVHELGHCFGRAHAVLGSTWDPHLVGPCQERRSFFGDPFFPYGFFDSSRGAKVPSLGPMDKGTNSLVYGIDLVSDQMAQNHLMDPTAIFELMSYCKDGADLDRWISAFTYGLLFDDLTSATPLVLVPEYRLLSDHDLSVQDFLVVRGDANPRAGTVTLRPLSRWRGMAPAWRPATQGAYQLQLLGAGGAVLVETNFDPTPYDGCGREESLIAGFNLPVPWSPGLQEVRVRRQGLVISRQVASANPPVVTKITPNGGELITANELRIAWEATDPDGNPLTYDVEFSADSGLSWRLLESETTATSFSLPRSILPGSNKALVRVTASDGIHTSTRTSAAVFSLPDQPPVMQVLSPSPGQWYQPGQQFAFQVSVQDPEEGRLGPTNVVWYGGNGIRLGTGASLMGNTDRLSKGEQNIRVVAFDGGGRAVTSTIPIRVSDRELAGYVDLRVQSGASPQEAKPGDRQTWTVTVRNRGTATATGVHLTNVFLRPVQISQVEVSQGTATNVNDQVTATLGQLAAGAEATLKLVTAAEITGSMKLSTGVGSIEPDIGPGDNRSVTEAIVSFPELFQPDLILTIRENPAAAQPGLIGDFYSSVQNQGIVTSSQVSLTNTLPAGVTLLSTEVSPGGSVSLSGSQVIARWPAVALNAQVGLRLRVRIESSDPLLFRAAVYGAEPDQEPLDNFMTSIVAPLGSDVTITRHGNLVVIQWPEARNYIGEQSDTIGPAQNWQPLQGTPILNSGRWSLTIPAIGNARFYRFR